LTVLEKRAQPFERRYRAEEVQLEAGLRRAATGICNDPVNPAAGQACDAIDQLGASFAGGKIRDDIRIMEITTDHPPSSFAKVTRRCCANTRRGACDNIRSIHG
jgi:hypothetical protein